MCYTVKWKTPFGDNYKIECYNKDTFNKIVAMVEFNRYLTDTLVYESLDAEEFYKLK